ncbi:MAG: phosphopantetheine-binding protein [Myxococcaceae bacterium]
MATEADVLETIRAIARTELELQVSVQPGDDLLADLGLDSLGLTVLAVGLENRYRVKLSQEDAVGLRTVEDLAKLVVRRSEASA